MNEKILEQEIESLKERISHLEKKFDDAIRDKSSLHPLTETQSKCLEEMRADIKRNGKISIRGIAKKLNISTSLVYYTKTQFIKRGLIKEVKKFYQC